MNTPRRPRVNRSSADVDDIGARLRALYDQHYRPLLKLASFSVDDLGSCEEVVQDAFVSLLTGHRHIEPGKEVAYLRVAVLNNSRSALRKRRVRRDKQPPAPLPAPGPESDALTHIEDHNMLRLLRGLPQRQADVLILRYYLDLSEAEIAATLDMAPGTVKSHAHRGLARLSALLENQR